MRRGQTEFFPIDPRIIVANEALSLKRRIFVLCKDGNKRGMVNK